MSDSDERGTKAGRPLWQLESNTTDSKETEQPTPESPNRETVIEQARKFLEEDEVRDASTDKKIAFLEGKGLKTEDITELLGVSKNHEATASSEPESTAPSQAFPSPSATSSYSSTHKRDAPPIITYPEFLTTPPHPTPLVTKSRLLTTLYLFGGLSALIYGTNNYLVKPMLASLTESRLSLAETTSSNLQKLIAKLETVVSEVPAGRGRIDAEEDGEESDEDPSEMFHRDVGIQTDLPSSISPTPLFSEPESTPLDDQTGRLTSLNISVTRLLDSSAAEERGTRDLLTTVNVLREYLDGLAYVAPSFAYGNSYSGGLSGNGAKDTDDEIGRVKASIRGVKGVLLSARSFPGGGGLRAR